MTMFNVSITIPDIEADNETEAAKLFLQALVSTDWGGGLIAEVINTDGDGTAVFPRLMREDIEAALHNPDSDVVRALEAVERWMRGYGTKSQNQILREYVEPALAKAKGAL